MINIDILIGISIGIFVGILLSIGVIICDLWYKKVYRRKF